MQPQRLEGTEKLGFGFTGGLGETAALSERLEERLTVHPVLAAGTGSTGILPVHVTTGWKPAPPVDEDNRNPNVERTNLRSCRVARNEKSAPFPKQVERGRAPQNRA